jgi:inorganic pyrophosphatase
MGKRRKLTALETYNADTGLLHVIIETPKGCRNKFEYDEKLGVFQLKKVLPLGAVFPYDFGFIPSTRAEDGDPLDILVMMDEPAVPGCLITVRLLGVIEAEQTDDGKRLRNDRLLGTLEVGDSGPQAKSLDDIPAMRLNEIEHFFTSYNEAEGRQFKVLRRRGPRTAEKLVKKAMRQFKKE